MEHCAEIDVSLESASVCVVDASGRIVCEVKVAIEPDVLNGWFGNLGVEVLRIGLEAGPLSQWHAGMREAAAFQRGRVPVSSVSACRFRA